MIINATAEDMAKIESISKAIKYLSISLPLMVIAYVFVYTFAQDTIFIYAVIPFVLFFCFSVIRLAWVGYSKFMGVVSLFSLLLPPAFFVMMIVAYSKATSFAKDKGIKFGFMGDITQVS
jgi:branched-subunit amino acid transport protein AzlD